MKKYFSCLYYFNVSVLIFDFLRNLPKCLPKLKTFFENLEVREFITVEVI